MAGSGRLGASGQPGRDATIARPAVYGGPFRGALVGPGVTTGRVARRVPLPQGRAGRAGGRAQTRALGAAAPAQGAPCATPQGAPSRGALPCQAYARVPQTRPRGPAARGQPGAGGPPPSRPPGLSEPTEQNARTGRAAISKAHARLRAPVARRGHRDDGGPDEGVGHGREGPLADGGPRCRVWPLGPKDATQPREAARPGERQTWHPVSRVGRSGGRAVGHPWPPDGAVLCATATRPKPSAGGAQGGSPYTVAGVL
jgi:hypothetical protein